MATWDSAWCLADFQEKAQRPAADAVPTATIYTYLTKAQNRVVALLAARCPAALYPNTTYGSIPTLSSTDGGYTFTFGTDSNGYAIALMGKASIYRQLADIPDYPMREGVDFIRNGAIGIMIPNNTTYSGTLYWRGVTPPADITATTQPALFPEPSRELIVIDAVRQFATAGGTDANLAALMQGEWNQAWPNWMLVWRTQYRRGGALQGAFSSLDMAMAAQL